MIRDYVRNNVLISSQGLAYFKQLNNSRRRRDCLKAELFFFLFFGTIAMDGKV